jgi:ribosome-binding protein aMBF1 (putative translation factor)
MATRKPKKSNAARKRKVSPVVRALTEFRRAKGLERDDTRFTEVGLNEITLERLESGYNQPNLDTLERYAQAMGFSLALRRTSEEDTAQSGLQLKLPKMRVLAMFNHAGGVGKTSPATWPTPSACSASGCW